MSIEVLSGIFNNGTGTTILSFGKNLLANAPRPAPGIVLFPGLMLSRHNPCSRIQLTASGLFTVERANLSSISSADGISVSGAPKMYDLNSVAVWGSSCETLLLYVCTTFVMIRITSSIVEGGRNRKSKKQLLATRTRDSHLPRLKHLGKIFYLTSHLYIFLVHSSYYRDRGREIFPSRDIISICTFPIIKPFFPILNVLTVCEML